MELTQSIRGAALGRIGVGATLVAKPDSAYAWIGGEADGRGAQVVTRALGIRDLVIGAGVLATAGDSEALRPWLLAGVAADAWTSRPRSPARARQGARSCWAWPGPLPWPASSTCCAPR